MPLSTGGVNATTMLPLCGVTVGRGGALGTGAGTTGSDGGDGALVPAALVAVTTHV